MRRSPGGPTPAAQDAARRRLAEELDAIIAPTNGPAWVTDPVNGDDFSMFIGSSSPSAVAGYATSRSPRATSTARCPSGCRSSAAQWDEPDLIGFAFDFEQATLVRVPPQFLPSIGD